MYLKNIVMTELKLGVIFIIARRTSLLRYFVSSVSSIAGVTDGAMAHLPNPRRWS
jgi:hypothetical protein